MNDLPSPYQPPQVPPELGGPVPPIEYSQQQAIPQKPGATAVLAWIVIWIVVILVSVVLPIIGGRAELAKNKPATTEPSVPTTPAPMPGPAPTSEAETKIASRLAIGFHELTRDDADAQKMLMPMFVTQLNTAPKTPHQRLCAAVVLGEIENAASAGRTVDLLVPDLKGTDREAAVVLQKLYSKGASALSGKDRDVLKTNLGWYGELALTHGAPPYDPARQALVHPAVRSIVTFSVAGVVIALALLVGSVLFIIALIRVSTGKLVRRLAEPTTLRPAPFVEAFALYIALFVVGAFLISMLVKGDALQWEVALIVLLPIAYVWPRIRGVSHTETVQTLGWHTGRGVLREMASGIVGYLTGLPIIFVGLIILLVLVTVSHAQPSHPIQQEGINTPAQIIKLYFIASIWAPIFEESMFRGALFGYMRTRWRWLASASLVALIFALIHPQGWTTVPALFAIALVLAGIREWRGSLIGSMTAHALHNGVLMTIFVLGVA
jgi:membrane protease YdiL (CAAX protease family)